MIISRVSAACLWALALLASADLGAAVTATIPAVQGNSLSSPLSGQAVIVEGIVTARTADGYFIQSPDNATDGLANTSEGLFVHLGAAPGATATVGNRVRVTGTVNEYRPTLQPHQLPLTRLTAVTGQQLRAGGQPLPLAQALPLADLGPGSDIAALERLEGMRVSASELVVVGAAGAVINEQALTAASDGVVHVITGNYVDGAAIPFREPGIPLLDASTPPAGKTLPVFDGNPQILRVDSRAQPGAPLLDLGLNDRITDAVGVLGYDGGRYSLLIDPVSPIQVAAGSRGEGAATAVAGEVKLLWLDLGRLFDASDDPARAEPVPSTAAYQARLRKLATHLCTFVLNPELIAVSGAENLQVLRDLAAMIDTNPSTYCPGPVAYQPLLVEGRDPSGLDIGFLLMGYTVDGVHPRVELVQAEQFAADATSPHPAGGSEPLFLQPPLRASVRVTDAAGRRTDITVVAVKFRELSGADSPAPGSNGWATEGERVMNLRARQAARLATWLQARQVAYPDEAIAVVGGFEADAFNDGRVDVLGIATGRPAPASQTWVAMPSPITTPLTNLTTLVPQHLRYNANDRGDFRALDHIVVNQAMQSKFGITPMSPRMNADFPASQRVAGGASFTFSARDPLMARLAVAAFIDADTDVRFIAPEQPSSRVDTRVYFEVANAGPQVARNLDVLITSSLSPAKWGISTQAPDWVCGAVEANGTGGRVRCRNPSLLATDTQGLEILIQADLALDGVTASFSATLAGAHNDPNPANNQASGSITFNNNTDLTVSIQGIGQVGDLLPGAADGFSVAVTRIAGPNVPGPTTVVATIDAPASEAGIQVGSGLLDCGPGVDIAPRRSRFTCQLGDNSRLEMAIFSVTYLTGLGDGGRVIGVTVEATPTTTDNNPQDNIASRSRRVSDSVDLVVSEPSLNPVPGRLDEPLGMYMTVANNVVGVARNARVEIDVNVAPELLGDFTATPYYSTVGWTCAEPQAAAGGARVVCTPPPLLQEPEFRDPVWLFSSSFTPEYRPGLADYPLTVTFTAFSDSEETHPANNRAQFATVIDQTTDLSVAIRTPAADVVEPAVARFGVNVFAAGTNAPRQPRARLELNAAFPAQDVAIFNHLGQPLACDALAAPAGRTHFDCPLGIVQGEALRVDVRTRPSLADTTLVLSAAVRNMLVDSQPANNSASGGARVIAIADLCVGVQCDGFGPPHPAKIDAGGVNTLRYRVKNNGPSTSRGTVVGIDVALAPSRIAARFEGQACAAATDIGGGRSRIACAVGNLLGNGAARELELDVDALGLPAANVALAIDVASQVFDPQLADNRIAFSLPVAPLMDLSLGIVSKQDRKSATAIFSLALAADGPPNVALSELSIRVESPGNQQPAQLEGPGWSCSLVRWEPETKEFNCVRTSPLSGAVPVRMAMTLPTASFMQIGTRIRVVAQHYYRADAMAVDRTPANNVVDHSLLVAGRSTRSVRTPAYGDKPAVAPKPGPPRAARKPER